METVEKTITVGVIKHTEDVNISLPYYSKDTCHVRALLSETTCMVICHGLEERLSIEKRDNSIGNFRAEETQCTKEEFDAIYQQVAMKLALLIA